MDSTFFFKEHMKFGRIGEWERIELGVGVGLICSPYVV